MTIAQIEEKTTSLIKLNNELNRSVSGQRIVEMRFKLAEMREQCNAQLAYCNPKARAKASVEFYGAVSRLDDACKKVEQAYIPFANKLNEIQARYPVLFQPKNLSNLPLLDWRSVDDWKQYLKWLMSDRHKIFEPEDQRGQNVLFRFWYIANAVLGGLLLVIPSLADILNWGLQSDATNPWISGLALAVAAAYVLVFFQEKINDDKATLDEVRIAWAVFMFNAAMGLIIGLYIVHLLQFAVVSVILFAQVALYFVHMPFRKQVDPDEFGNGAFALFAGIIAFWV